VPAPGSAWSRSEWLRRLGYKTGQEPPIASAIQPTLRSGDASELLPPLLAPQGWGRIWLVAAPGAGSFHSLEVIGSAPGGAFVEFNGETNVAFSIEDARRPTFSVSLVAPLQIESPGVQTVANNGVDTAALDVQAPRFGVLFSPNLVEFISPKIHVPPGKFFYVQAQTAALVINGAFHVRDVPVGLAPD